MVVLIQVLSFLGWLGGLLWWVMWSALVLVPWWLAEKAIPASAAAVAQADGNADVEGSDEAGREHPAGG